MTTHRLLLVEDDADTVETLGPLLEEAGYEVSSATDGVDAFVRLRYEALPDAVLLDLWLPVVGGAEVLEQIRGDPVLARLPVVVITAAPISPAVTRLADAVIQKPFNLEQLLQILATLLTDNERAAPSVGA
jgi:CheY-like chemotaxis protein